MKIEHVMTMAMIGDTVLVIVDWVHHKAEPKYEGHYAIVQAYTYGTIGMKPNNLIEHTNTRNLT